jgi:CarboxypepD_reg-like domain
MFFLMTLIRKIFLIFLLSLFILPALKAQRTVITGKVSDNNGKPVPAASVTIKNTNTGTSTDTLGAFSLRVRPRDSLIISAVGFGDTSLIAGGRHTIDIILLPRTVPLQEAVVTGAAPGADNSSSQEATREQIIMDAFQDYLRSAEFSNGQLRTTSMVAVIPPPGRLTVPFTTAQTHQVSTSVNGFGPLNTLNSGGTLPMVTHQENTRGSRYLLKHFVRGVILDKDGHVMTDSLNLLNYDKIDGQLMIAQTAGTYLEVDKDKVVAFALRDQDSAYVFLNVPALSKVNYFLLIATGPRYSIYKSIRTNFVKANYQSNGLIETGNNYNEYVDKQTYFWVDGQGKAGIFELKKKLILEALAGEKAKVGAYFAKHKYDDVDDAFVRNLINYLNAPRDNTQP